MKSEVTRRYAYIETRLYWGEGLTATNLGQTFGIARQNAQAVIKNYRDLYPDNIQYDAGRKRHIKGSHFKPHYIRIEPEKYLEYVRGVDAISRYWAADDWNEVLIEDVERQLQPKIKSKTVKLILSAIQNEQTLSILYHSNDDKLRRTLSPHHLVYVNHRYHVRAYCHLDNAFLDFTLARMKAIKASSQIWKPAINDQNWHQYFQLCFKINPELPEPVQSMLKIDYQLKGNEHCISTRKALEFYILRVMKQRHWKHQMPLWVRID
ncbi:MAG: WYL domain-containing protein [Cocleimonas sp.]|nr:WYL domain-containing protein [Cocleimonas sp.]